MITEDIDLTLNSLFSELHVPEHERVVLSVRSNISIVEDYDLFYKMIHHDESLHSVYIHAILYGSKYDDILMEDVIETYKRVFDEYPLYTNQIDPYFHYFQGAGITCDCCGERLHILNSARSNTLCEKCDYTTDQNKNEEFEL